MTLFFSKQKVHSSKLLTTYPFLSLPFVFLTFCQWFFWWVLFFTSPLASLTHFHQAHHFVALTYSTHTHMPKNPLSTSINNANAQFCNSLSPSLLNLSLPNFCHSSQLSFSLSSQSFFAQFLPLFSTHYISLWDAMNKLWCGPVGNEFKRWRVRINKGGGEIDGHKKHSQHFRANFQKGIGCSM
jgi:hypothetical protein